MKKIALLALLLVMFGIFQLSSTPHILVSDPTTWFNTPNYETGIPVEKFTMQDREDGFFLPYEDVTNKEFILHKLAHIFFFSLLAVCAYYTFKKNALIAWLFVTAYALFDELHQALVIGRSGRALDVSLDSLAGLLTIGVLYVLYKKESQPRPTNKTINALD